MFDVNIISTGSQGNMIIIDKHIIIDIGLSYKLAKPFLEDFEAIFVTHRHGDHLNLSVIKNIIKDKENPRPWILKNTLYTNLDTALHIKKNHNSRFNFEVNPDHIFTSNSKFDIIVKDTTYTVETFLLEHDVENQGFIITKNVDGEECSLIYATDTKTMKHAPRRKYDCLIIEGNYDQDKLFDHLHSDHDEIRRRALRNLRHLSIQDFEDFVKNNKKEDAKIYQLHESGEYGVKSELGLNNL